MYVSDPGNDGRVHTTIPIGCAAVGARGCTFADAAFVPAILWTTALPPWSSCRSRARPTVPTICHLTANAPNTVRILPFYRNAATRDVTL